jgi:hypothetical protein
MAKDESELSDEEAERRMNDALRRSLTTPYKPQREMVGTVGRSAKRKPSKAVKKPKQTP